MIIKRTSFLIFFLLTVIFLQAQKSEIYLFPDRDFIRGTELYRMKKYGAAQKLFNNYLANHADEKITQKSEAQYYAALCAIELFHLESEYLVFQFATQNPESPMVNNAWFRLAGYFYKNKSYSKALIYYDKVDRSLLDDDEISEFYFNKGYSYYTRNDYEKARVAFYEIKDVDGKYSSPALIIIRI